MADYKQYELEPQAPKQKLEDFFEVKGGIVTLKGTLQTDNFIPSQRGVRIERDGLNANGGTVSGATVSLSDFTDAQHDHSGTSGGGQLTSAAISGQISVAKGGTGAATLTGIVKGNGTSAMTAIVGWSGTFYVATSSGGAVTHAVTVDNGIITNVA